MAESCKTLHFDFVVPISKTIVGVSFGRLSALGSLSVGRYMYYDRIAIAADAQRRAVLECASPAWRWADIARPEDLPSQRSTRSLIVRHALQRTDSKGPCARSA